MNLSAVHPCADHRHGRGRVDEAIRHHPQHRAGDEDQDDARDPFQHGAPMAAAGLARQAMAALTSVPKNDIVNHIYRCSGDVGAYPGRTSGGARSEEHTSELQSLMRISYAVFCLKKKNVTLQ